MHQVIRRVGPAVAILAWLLCAGHASAATPASCKTSLGSLNGSYALLITGGKLASGTPKYQTAVAVFNGSGNVFGTDAYGAAGAHSSVTGTYVQNSDCTYTIDFTGGVLSPSTFTVALDSAGEAVGIEVDSTAVANISLKPQSAQLGSSPVFNASSLNGSYALVCSGPLTQSSDVNLVTFNNGTLSGTDPYNNGGSFAAANVPYTGSYVVNSNGSFTGNLTVTGTTFFFYGAAAPANSELVYIYENTQGGKPIDSFAGCVGGTSATSSGGGGGTGTTAAFTLSPSQPTLQVFRGLFGSSRITVKPATGFKGNVTFTASGQPRNVTTFFAPSSSASSTNLTFFVSFFAPSGSYPITITGTAPGVASQTTTVTLVVR